MSDHESETINSESEISGDQSLHTSDEDFTDDSDSESEDEEHFPGSKIQKIDKIEVKIKK